MPDGVHVNAYQVPSAGMYHKLGAFELTNVELGYRRMEKKKLELVRIAYSGFLHFQVTVSGILHQYTAVLEQGFLKSVHCTLSPYLKAEFNTKRSEWDSH